MVSLIWIIEKITGIPNLTFEDAKHEMISVSWSGCIHRGTINENDGFCYLNI